MFFLDHKNNKKYSVFFDYTDMNKVSFESAKGLLLCCWHTALSLISTRWSNGSYTDLRLPGRHLGMDERTAQPGKDRASCLPCHSNSTAWLHDSVRFFYSKLGVIFDDQLTFKEHIAKTARSCRFALHNIRKIRPFLTEHIAQLLVISRLDYCNALLAGLPSNTIKPLQMIQNAAARLVFNEPKRAYVTPLFWRFSTAWYGTVRYGSLLGGFLLGTVPGTWYFFSTTSAEVPNDPYRYQNVTCKLCWSLIGRRESSLLRQWTCNMRPARFKSAQPAKERTQDAAFVSTNAPFCINHKFSVLLSVEEVQTFLSLIAEERIQW